MTLKCGMIVPTMDKGWSIVTVVGFHRIANPLVSLVKSVWRDSHPLQQRWEIVSSCAPTHLVSCNGRTFGFSARIHSWRVLYLDLPLSPLMFQVMIFIMMIGEVGGGIPSRSFEPGMSWAWSSLLLWWAGGQIYGLIFCFPVGRAFSLRMGLWLCLPVQWILLWNQWTPYEPF